jgi:hypothetical protein
LLFGVSLFVMLFRNGRSPCRFRLVFFRGVFTTRRRFAFIVGQNPVWQASREPSRSSRTWLHSKRRTCHLLLVIRLPFFWFLFSYWLNWCLLRTPTILRQRLARQYNVVLSSLYWTRCRRPRAAIARRPTVIVAA